ncbi:MAG: ROK family protein [Clostridiales bacterium]|nr:ROK family protein [Clostridiales bacterium]
MIFAGIDIGGTKCAACIGTESENGELQILSKERFDTIVDSPYDMIAILQGSLHKQLSEMQNVQLDGIGISCGGPLSSKTGTILAPPNLPKWDNIPITASFEAEFKVHTTLQNDANACAIAEWKYGSGKGTHNFAFLTFGTGFGAGLILNSQLYCGSNDMAGEIGHIRAETDGPVGYRKHGSFEGFCSGAGIAQLGRMMVIRETAAGNTPKLLSECGDIPSINAKAIAELAEQGDALCRDIYRISGEKLGKALSIMVDLLDLDAISIGSIFTRSYHLLWDSCNKVMEQECLPISYRHCRILKSVLGDKVGDIAALAIAAYSAEK